MKMILSLVLALGVAVPAGAETPLDFADFHSVEVRNDIVATIAVGDAFDVAAEVVRGDIAQLVPAQFGDWLRLDRSKRWLIWTNGRRDQFDVAVTMPEVRELKALSGAQISAVLGQQDQFRAEAANATITVSVDTPNLRLRGNDGAVITVTGTCGRLTMLARPTSVMDLSGLVCDSIVLFGDKSRVDLPSGANIVNEHPEPES